MKKIIFLVSSFLVNMGMAQQVLIQDFSTTSSYTAIQSFEGSGPAAIVSDPAAGGTRGDGFQVNSLSTGNPWQGGEFVLTTKKVKLTTDKTMKVDVYSTVAFTLLSKLSTGGPDTAASANYTTPGAWQTLTLDFAVPRDGQQVANGEYSKVIFFGNWKSDNTGWNNPANFTYHIDNIMAEESVAVPDPVPATSAPNPTQAASDVVLSLYNDKPGYTPAYVQEGAFGSRTLINLDAENDETMKFTFAAGGWGQYNNTTVNISDANYLHLSYYVPSATPAGANGHGFYIMINSGSGEKKFSVKPTGGDATMIFDSWQTVSIPMTFFTSQGFNPASFLVWKIDADSDINTKLLYIDNIFFTKSVLGTSEASAKNAVKVYPNPVTAGEMITVDANVKSIEIFTMTGQKVKSAASKSISSQGLSKGVYMIKTTNEKGETQSSKLIVK